MEGAKGQIRQSIEKLLVSTPEIGGDDSVASKLDVPVTRTMNKLLELGVDDAIVRQQPPDAPLIVEVQLAQIIRDGAGVHPSPIYELHACHNSAPASA